MKERYWVLIVAVIVGIMIYLALTDDAHAATPEYFNKVVDAIYIAEGGAKAIKPFGILSVPCEGYADCRKVCYNTVRNNWRRWEKAGRPGEYLDFLGNRYAPPQAHPLNKNWIPNVRRILG